MKLSTRLTISMILLVLLAGADVAFLINRSAPVSFDIGMTAGIAAILGLLVLSVVAGRSLERRHSQIAQLVEAFARGEPVAAPAGAGYEVGALANYLSGIAAKSRERQLALQLEIEERRRIFDTSPDLILVTDSRGHFTRVSLSSKSILGYQPEELIGHPVRNSYSRMTLRQRVRKCARTRQGRVMRNFDTRYVGKDGGVVSLSWSGVWSEPTKQYFFTGRDRTELQIIEEKFRLAVEASPSGLVMIDDKGSIVLVNAETERLFGYRRDELVGSSVEVLIPERLRGHHAQHRDGFLKKPEARRMGTGRELFGLHKDGSEFPIEIGLNPIQTEHGILILSVVVDITERKRNERALLEYAEREQLFIAAVESSNDAIVTKTLDGVINGWNQAAERLFGFTAGDAIGKPIDIIVPVELRGEVTEILGSIRAGKKVEHHETQRIHKDGHRIDVSLSVSPIKSHSGTIIGAAKVARDITSRKKAVEALRASEQMAKDIIAGALDGFVQTNEDGEVIEWNPRAEEIFGWSRQEALGKRLAELYLPAEYLPHYEALKERLRANNAAAIAGERKVLDAVTAKTDAK